MKKIVASLLLLTFMVSILCGCSIPGRKPTEGLWYCADLGISIDFSLLAQENISIALRWLKFLKKSPLIFPKMTPNHKGNF